MTKLVKDSQSRIVRYGMKCFEIIDGVKCQSFANAKKKGNNLVISEAFSSCIDANGQSVSGTYKIVSVGAGRIAEVVCEKL